MRAIADFPVQAQPAAKPEDVRLVVRAINLCPYLLEDVDSSPGKAKRVLLLAVRVKGCLSSVW